MPSYPTPGALPATSAAPLSLPKIFTALRGGSVAPIVNAVWVPATSALLIILAGAIGFWLKQPWLFAALGPTIIMMASTPGHETTSFRAVTVGHISAMACAYMALMLLNANDAATLAKAVTIVSPRVWASALALALLALVQPQLRAYHPPAAATALLITLGAYRMTGRTPLALVGGVVLVAVAAELLNRVRPRRGR
jgi:hypothetical protein